MRPDCRGHRVPCSRHGLVVSNGPCGISPSAVHHSLSTAASSSRELSVSFRVLRHPTCPACSGQPCGHPEAVERLPWGSGPSSRHRLAASTYARRSQPRALVRPRRFSRPRRFAPPPALRVCFAPQPRPGFALQGFVPLAEPYRVSPARHALVPLDAPACGLTRASLRALDFRALLPARVRCREEVISPSSIRAPLGLRLLRVLSPRNVGTISGPLRPRPW